MRNTSQDPDYEGLPYHEKKFHKTHFGALKREWKSAPSKTHKWVKIGVGRYKLVKIRDDEENRRLT